MTIESAGRECGTVRVPSYAELLARTDAPAGSSWYVFGPDDELGTVNFATPERVAAAARGIRRGATFNLDLPLDMFAGQEMGGRCAPEQEIIRLGRDYWDDRLDRFFPQGTTQVDGLRHCQHRVHGLYNGFPAAENVPGNPRIGVGKWAERAVAGRGVLVDLAYHYEMVGEPLDVGVGTAIPIEDVVAAADRQGVDFRPGDVLMLRTGWLRGYREGRAVLRGAQPGLLQSHETLSWLWDNQIAAVVADNPGVEVMPPDPSSPFAAEFGEPRDAREAVQAGMMHPHLIALLGFLVGELWDLEALAADCREDGIWESFVTIKPLHLTGGLGSPANAMAIK
ncbi:cyclase family protein [Pseudonocardia ailaonensis]